MQRSKNTIYNTKDYVCASSFFWVKINFPTVMALNLKWKKAQALLGTIDWMKQTRRREEYHLHIFLGFAWTKRKGKEEEESYTQLLSIVEYMSIPALASTVSPSNHNTFLSYSPISSLCSGWKIRLKWDFCNVKYSLFHFLKAYLSIEY